MSARLPDWQSRLAALLAARVRTPLTYGTNDCCLLAADAVQAMTGHDPARGLRRHRTAAAAASTLRKHGGVAAIAAARLGPEIAPSQAAVGDVGLASCGGQDALVVCGGGVWLGPGPDGLLRVPAAAVTRAWRGECRA